MMHTRLALRRNGRDMDRTDAQGNAHEIVNNWKKRIARDAGLTYEETMESKKVTRKRWTIGEKLDEIARVRQNHLDAIKALDERAEAIKAEARKAAEDILSQVGD